LVEGEDLTRKEEQLKTLILCVLAIVTIVSVSFAGSEYSGKEMKQIAQLPCPEWYADNEWNVSLWGTYVFTGNEWRNDRYIEADHAWGGGMDAKYFFHRYFGVGLEGWAVDARREFIDVSGVEVFQFRIGHESRAVGSILGTFTLRYPIHCSRFGRMFGREAARSSAAVRETSFTLAIIPFSPVSQPNIGVPRRRRLASSEPAWKFALRRTLAGSVISAGTLLMVGTTISGWCARELISRSRIWIARESLELCNSAFV
jgi:hypothetical protein